MGTIEPWVDIVERERRDRGLSQDDLAYAARSHGGPSGLSSAWFSKVKQGQRPATIEFLRGIAGALGLQPERFAEYRLAIARQQLDEREVGLEQAVQALEASERGEPMALAGADGSDAVRAKRAALAAKRAREETQKSRRRSPGTQPSKEKKRRAG